MRNNERHLRCEQFTYEDVMSISRVILETEAVNVEFDCGRVEVWDVEENVMYEFSEVLAMIGYMNFTDRCVSICATGYQYGFEDRWDVLVIEED